MDFLTMFDSETQSTDLVIDGMHLAIDDGLETSVLLSLFTDRRAPVGIELPDGTDHRRGWFGDADAEPADDPIGSLLWLLAREKQTDEVLERARRYARDALAWLITDDIARAVEVDGQWLPDGQMALSIAVTRADGTVARFRYDKFWSALNGV